MNQSFFTRKSVISNIFIIIMTIVGLIGLFSPKPSIMIDLIPIYLIFSALILVKNHRERKSPKNFYYTLATISLVLILLYVIGSYTGWIFGKIIFTPSESNPLGWIFLKIPLLVVIIWLNLIIAITSALKPFEFSKLINILSSSFILVSIDIILETVATKLKFWHFNTYETPVQNFVAWFIISLIVFTIYYNGNFRIKNKVGITYLISFILINLIIFFYFNVNK